MREPCKLELVSERPIKCPSTAILEPRSAQDPEAAKPPATRLEACRPKMVKVSGVEPLAEPCTP